jgi:serine/threonine protein kinase
MWVGQHRHLINRQLVRIKQLPRTFLSDCQKLARISHDNVIRPESFYYETEYDKFFIVFEYLHLNVFDLFPLYPKEVPCIMKQVSLSFSGGCDG